MYIYHKTVKKIREIITTKDGSSTFFLPEWNESYHSKHGAIQESAYVFIKNGLNYWLKQNNSNSLKILEIGFGTGLNCFLTFLESEKSQFFVEYVSVEAFPISIEEAAQLNYTERMNAAEFNSIFEKIHQNPWNQKKHLTPYFTLTKRLDYFENITENNCFDVIYFDAFSARNQPELWTQEIFSKMHRALKINGILVTYAAKGSARRAMQAAGLVTEKLVGPPGKREMLRATKL